MHRRRFLSLAPGLALLGCASLPHGPASLRLINYVAGGPVEIRLEGPSTTLEPGALAYADPRAGLEVEPGQWTLIATREGVEIARCPFAVGVGRGYTLLLVGEARLSGAGERPGRLEHALELLAAGSEHARPRGLWPRLIILEDNLERDQDRVHLRFVHAAPGTTPLEIEELEPEPRALAELAYGEAPVLTAVDPAQLSLEFRQQDAGVGGLRQRFTGEAGILYTLIFVGDPIAGEALRIERIATRASFTAG
ncbi:DUF4397 domain-containing protein [Pseudenhygromyxa sp. WMMC2535]|uniref:DUF4397 domain-containing protein n=1 Tax=Pseudenhygromyxa sp. WMMC2535 TaxID=2712867 RepID=UPI001556135D|nr:DUF4397 domain-containing protein [Pseudenhygromyxa sp. WMMC2535]NVB40671.1 DUF4397 domain-containing protein [Pseudenhygromyxa sp. WMMC2535]